MAWLVTLLLTGVAAGLLTLAHLPAATLFGALVAGLVVSVSGRARRQPVLPARVNTAAQAVVGVLTGALVQPETLRALASDWLPVLASVVATLVLSLAAGMLFGLHRDVDPVTGSFALVAGGASGLTAISEELGADQRIVAVVQYLRVLLIVVAMPAVAALLPAGSGGSSPVSAGAPWWADVLLTAGCAVAGLALAHWTRLPAGSLIGPMLVTAVLAGTGLSGGATVPGPLLEAAYVAVGLQVGLSFTRESLRAVRRVLPVAIALILGLTAATAAAGILLLRFAGASVLDAYLATTPGGLYAVLATAVDTGADTTLVLTVQVLRLVVMLALAPAIAVLLHRRR
jgi:uncharacterized protein